MGISPLCDLNDPTIPNPPIFGHRLLYEYKDTEPEYEIDEDEEGALAVADERKLPVYVKKKFNELDSHRRYTTSDIFSEDREEYIYYDAYEKDIATVHFFFESSTVFQYTRTSRMGPVEYISQVGGLLGLCLGFSFCSAIEIVYWFFFRLWFRVKKGDKDSH